MTSDRPRRRATWLLVLAGVVLAASTYLCFGPLPASTAAGSVWCPAGPNAVAALSPSDPLPMTDPDRARADACLHTARTAAPYGFGLMVPGAVILLLWARRQTST